MFLFKITILWPKFVYPPAQNGLKREENGQNCTHTRMRTRALNVYVRKVYTLHLTRRVRCSTRRVHKEPGVKPKAERPKRHERKIRNVYACPEGACICTPEGCALRNLNATRWVAYDNPTGCHIPPGGLKASREGLKKKKNSRVRMGL